MPGLTLHPVLPRSCASLLHPIKSGQPSKGSLAAFKVQKERKRRGGEGKRGWLNADRGVKPLRTIVGLKWSSYKISVNGKWSLMTWTDFKDTQTHSITAFLSHTRIHKTETKWSVFGVCPHLTSTGGMLVERGYGGKMHAHLTIYLFCLILITKRLYTR